MTLAEPGRPPLLDQIYWFYFLGTDPLTVWQASLVTARKAFWDEATGIASDRREAMQSPDERQRRSTISAQESREHLNHMPENERKEESDQLNELTRDVILNSPPTIYESFTIDRTYWHGIGLSIVLDVEVIDQAAVEMAIDRFLAIGETDWVSSTQVPRDRLPTVTELDVFATIKFPIK